MSVTIYHNPRCSNSRSALALLEGKGVKPVVIEYLKTPPTAAELRGLLAKLRMRPRDLIRSKEAVYSALGLADESLSDEALISAMAENPILIQRPIIVKGDRAIIGRPPETVLDFV